MSDQVFQFTENEVIGRVVGVDTAHVAILVTNPSIVPRLVIGHIVAIKGNTEAEQLIGLIERVTRGLMEQSAEAEPDETDIISVVTPGDTIRITLIGTFRTVDGQRKNTFKRGADSFPQLDKISYLIDSGNLQRFMGLLGSGLKDEEKLILGSFIADRSAVAIASGDKLFQRHAAVLGSTGSGKSWAVALLLERASKLQSPNIIVFDLHGEYEPLTDKSKGGYATRYKIAGPGELDKVEPNIVFLPYWLLNRDELLSMLLDRSDQNAPNQASRFTTHIRALKEKTLLNGHTDLAKTFTVDSPIPFALDDLLTCLKDDDTRKGIGAKGGDVKGEWEGKLTRFISRLEAKTQDRRYGFMFKPIAETLKYEWLQDFAVQFFSRLTGEGIKIVDFSEVPSDILPVVTGVFARLLYDIQFWMEASYRHPMCIFCDEAHLYLPTKEDADAVEKQALWNFERIAKEGRKYGFGLVVISQRPSDVSRTILSQCNNFIALRLTNESDQAVIRRLVPDSLAQIVDNLPLLDVGEALVLGDAMLLPTRIKLDIPSVKPESATKDFWQEWNTKNNSDEKIKSAVESLRAQHRPK